MKQEIKIITSYSMRIEKYRDDMPFEEENEIGEAILSITKEEYYQLKEAGVPYVEKIQVTLSPTMSFGEQAAIRQVIFQHELQVDEAHHTN